MNTCKDILVSLIKEFEGCELTAYPDPGTKGDPYTIGYGQTGKDIKKSTKWTQSQADEALEKEVSVIIDNVLKDSIALQKATPSKQAAVCDFVYNCGSTNYKKSTLKKYIDYGKWDLAANEILKWNKAAGKVMKGLTRRRERESNLLRM